MLYFLLAAHPARTIVFANAVSTIRRVAAILQQLGVPAAPLHASMQQRQRLKVTTLSQAGLFHYGPIDRMPSFTASCGRVCHDQGSFPTDSPEPEYQHVAVMEQMTSPEKCMRAASAWHVGATQALDRFKSSPSGVLVATDVAARGLDVKGVACVIHYQVPAAQPCAVIHLVKGLAASAAWRPNRQAASRLLCAQLHF